MERLILFVYQNRAFFTFLFLELFCAWLIVQNNAYQGSKFFNSSNGLVAAMNSFSQSVRDYFMLTEVNRTLSEENALLKRKLSQQPMTFVLPNDSIYRDSSAVNQYQFVSAKVVNNHVDMVKNFITINKGSEDGIEAGMAVISPLGVVGKVKLVSNHYGVVTSILHVDVMVSAVLKRTEHFGTVRWDGKDPDVVELNYIPPHVRPNVGDTVVTSGYNAVFPQNVMIGVISSVDLNKDALFYDIKVRLSQDFRKLAWVTVVKNTHHAEQDSLEQVIQKLER
ncbi:rod shape-determining protein MreC [Chryseolinea sp. T2]|uniref:rod shape-determining protein MreC n=1 Tax=Chryseolinea sp. T2 TaxID=3129255 RepID=UPI0030774DC6